MEQYTIIILLLAVSVGITAFSPKIKIPYPIFLLIGGIVIGLIPGFQRISLDSGVVLLIFLPPLLYDAASNISFKKFRENINVISFLSVPLVLATMFGIAVFAYICIPKISWPLALLLGAILSPPDTVAALGITGDLKLSRRLRTIIEGEGLINDATALIAFGFALNVSCGERFTFWNYFKGGLEIFGGVVIGIGMWYIFQTIANRISTDNRALISLNFLFPFVAYLLAEGLNGSGVLAVSTIGLLMARNKNEIWRTHKKIMEESKAVWASLTLMLNGLAFILLGIEFPHVIKSIPGDKLVWLIFYSFWIFIVALGVRATLLSLFKINWDRTLPRVKERDKYLKHLWLYRKINLNLDPIGWKDLIVISCSGMRGIVSLAAALAIPIVLNNGSKFPQRDTIIFLAITVVIMMLIIQGLGLAPMLRFLKLDYQVDSEPIESVEHHE